MTQELSPAPNGAFEIYQGQRPSPIVLVCDHASNKVPDEIAQGDLGLPAQDMARHIAYDVGAAGLTRALADALDAPAVLSCFSRLVIDPNRDPRDPTVLMRLYDGSVIPANRDADAAERAHRVAMLHQPYHDAIETLLAQRTAPVIVSIHSFTAQLRGYAPRPWHVGVLYADEDPRLSRALLDALRRDETLCVGENQPYKGHLPGDTIDRHALRPGHHNALLELRNDLIATPEQQQDWAAKLAPMLRAAMTATGAT